MFIINEHIKTLNMIAREEEILDQAIAAFEKETNLRMLKGGLEIYLEGNRLADATLQLECEGKEIQYWAEIKTTIQTTALAEIARNFAEAGKDNWLIVTRYVYPKLGKTMRELGIQFIDTVGNAYLNNPRLLIHIQAHRRKQDTFNGREEGIFGPAGLKVIFALLCKRDLLNKNYRQINQEARVALGTVTHVMKDLTARGYLVERQNAPRRLVRKKELFDKWVTEYAAKMWEKTLIGRYKAQKNDFWQQTDITKFGALLGGETAAYELTRYLKPQTVTIYARRPINDLLFDLKLRKDEEGNVEIRERFWKFDLEIVEKLVPAPLVYADLLATGEARNIETAKMLYADHIKRYIDED